MHKHCKRPIVFPLSNPTSRVEATPNDIIRWTNGEALVATGSPFDPVVHEGRTYPIAQCNNSYIFPGIGLGVLAVNAKRVTDEMLMESTERWLHVLHLRLMVVVHFYHLWKKST